MISVIRTGGKQYIVSPGDKITVEKLDKKEGEKVEFDKVLLKEDNGKVVLGTPYIEGTKVVGKSLGEKRGEKKVIFKYKPKKRYKVKRGHKQTYTEVEIEKI